MFIMITYPTPTRQDMTGAIVRCNTTSFFVWQTEKSFIYCFPKVVMLYFKRHMCVAKKLGSFENFAESSGEIIVNIYSGYCYAGLKG